MATTRWWQEGTDNNQLKKATATATAMATAMATATATAATTATAMAMVTATATAVVKATVTPGDSNDSGSVVVSAGNDDGGNNDMDDWRDWGDGMLSAGMV